MQTYPPDAPLEAYAARKRAAADYRDRQAAQFRREAAELEEEAARRRRAAKKASR